MRSGWNCHLEYLMFNISTFRDIDIHWPAGLFESINGKKKQKKQHNIEPKPAYSNSNYPRLSNGK